MKKTVITLSVLTCLAIAALIFKPMAEPSKQNILHKKHATHGFTKPRSTFVIHRLPSKSENSISLSLEVAGPFDHYEFNWWMPDST
ncbi:MAG: hypothetical protein KDD37_08395, partial [Bdellovibrionales bacterium]|nr:hypothetical protein [Bdellovibrionales bacterium]